nr:hypothetical protein [Tanacetum cinerariifolium]
MALFDYHLNPLYPIKECSSCGALYTTDYCCSEGNLMDKIIYDLNQPPDLSQRPLQNCPKCGNPVDGQYCQGCALLRKKLKEDLFTYCIKNRILQDASEPSNDNTNVVNALQEPFIVKQDPGKNSSQSPPQINHHCCYGCGDSLEDIFCHQCTCEFCRKGAHYGYNCPSKVLIIPNPRHFNNQTIDKLPQTMPSFNPTCYYEDGNSFTYDSKSNLVDDSPNVFNPPPRTPTYSYKFCGNNAYYGHDCSLQVLSRSWETILKIKLAFEDKHCQPEDILELFRRLHNDVQNIHEELAVYINTPSWYCPTVCYNNDDDEDCTISITLKEPDNSLSMRDEHLDTIPVTKSDEFIKSSVENLVPSLSESEGEHECDVPACDDFTTFSNILFDANYDFSSSDDQLILYEFASVLTLLKTISPGINETDCDREEEICLIKRLLYDNSSPRPLKEFVSENFDASIEYFSTFPIPVEDSDSFMEEFDLSFTLDDPMPTGIEEDDYDSERDILILEELLSNDSLSLPENESFHFDIPSSPRPPAKPPDGTRWRNLLISYLIWAMKLLSILLNAR